MAGESRASRHLRGWGLLALAMLSATALVGLVSAQLVPRYRWRREAAEIVARLNQTHRADPDEREKDVEDLCALLRRRGSESAVERLVTSADPGDRELGRFAIAADASLGCRVAERWADDADESIAFQARLTLGRWPSLAPLGTVPESRLAGLVAATKAFKYGVDDFHEKSGEIGALELDGPGSARIVLEYVERGAHNQTTTALVFDARGERVCDRLEAGDGSIRWILWHGAPAALASEVYGEAWTGGATELVGVVAVRHRLVVWRGERGGRFEEADTFYTPFVEKYP